MAPNERASGARIAPVERHGWPHVSLELDITVLSIHAALHKLRG